jgi:hypothetical protein
MAELRYEIWWWGEKWASLHSCFTSGPPVPVGWVGGLGREYFAFVGNRTSISLWYKSQLSYLVTETSHLPLCCFICRDNCVLAKLITYHISLFTYLFICLFKDAVSSSGYKRRMVRWLVTNELKGRWRKCLLPNVGCCPVICAMKTDTVYCAETSAYAQKTARFHIPESHNLIIMM